MVDYVDEVNVEEKRICEHRGHEVVSNTLPKAHKFRCLHCNLVLLWQPPIDGYWYSRVNAESTAELSNRENVRESYIISGDFKPV